MPGPWNGGARDGGVRAKKEKKNAPPKKEKEPRNLATFELTPEVSTPMSIVIIAHFLVFTDTA